MEEAINYERTIEEFLGSIQQLLNSNGESNNMIDSQVKQSFQSDSDPDYVGFRRNPTKHTFSLKRLHEHRRSSEDYTWINIGSSRLSIKKSRPSQHLFIKTNP
jgi:hypothetical protein